VPGENGERATDEAAEKLENLSLSCDPAADSQVSSSTFYPLAGVHESKTLDNFFCPVLALDKTT